MTDLDGDGSKNNPYIVRDTDDYLDSLSETDSFIRFELEEDLDLSEEVNQVKNRSKLLRAIGLPLIIGLTISVQLYGNSLLITIITFVISSIILYTISYPNTSQFRYNRFNGELDGNYETVDLNEVGHALFKEIEEDGVVKNLRLRNQQVDSGDEIGAVANVNNGAIRQVIVEDSVIEGRDRVGGLAGVNKGCIDNCIVNSTTVRGRNVVGGFVGLCSDSYTRHCQAYNCEVETDSIGDDESYGGGFTGGVQNKSIVMDCHASGSIQGEYTGQFVGQGSEGDYGNHLIKRCVSSVTGASRVFAFDSNHLIEHGYYDESCGGDRHVFFSSSDEVAMRENHFYVYGYRSMREHQLVESDDTLWEWDENENEVFNSANIILERKFDSNLYDGGVRDNQLRKHKTILEKNPNTLDEEFTQLKQSFNSHPFN